MTALFVGIAGTLLAKAIPALGLFTQSQKQQAVLAKKQHDDYIEDLDLEAGKLKVKLLPRGTAWLDTGTFRSLIQASNFVQTIEERQGFGVGCIEAVAYSNGFINSKKLKEVMNTPHILWME